MAIYASHHDPPAATQWAGTHDVLNISRTITSCPHQLLLPLHYFSDTGRDFSQRRLATAEELIYRFLENHLQPPT